MSVSDEQYKQVTDLLAHVILQTGPVLLEVEDISAGLPDDAKSVVIEQTQEGYLVYISDKKKEDFNDESE